MVWTPRQSRMLGTSDGVVATAAVIAQPRRVQTSQPLSLRRLDWGNPILRAINPIAVYAPIGNRMHEFVRGGAATSFYGTNDLLQPDVRPLGGMVGGYTGVCSAATLNGHWETGLFADSVNYRFLFTLVTSTSTIAAASYSAGIHDGTARFYMGLSYSIPGNLNMGWGSVAPAFGRKSPVVVGVPEALAFDVGSTQLTGYQNGIGLGSTAASWPGGPTTRNFYIGKRTNNTGSDATHNVDIGSSNLTHLVIIGSNVISAWMHKSLADNPWQIFASDNAPIWGPT